MRIALLADHPEIVPELARLHMEQWGHLRPGETLERRTARLTAACGRGQVPTVFVALEDDGSLAGSSMLIESDMDTRPELRPWLAGVYVVEASRGRGYGSALVLQVEEAARALGIERVFLYTPDAMEFYERLGWVRRERVSHLGQDVTIMAKEPHTPSGA